MKRIQIIIFITIFFTISNLFITNIFAQNEGSETGAETGAETVTTKTFELELYKSTQSIFDGSIPLNLGIKSLISSERMQIRWKLPAGLKQTDTGKSLWTSIEERQEVMAQTSVLPEKPGTYRVVAEVQAWQAEANYVDTVAIDLTFDNDLMIQPQTEQYYQNQQTWLIARIGILIAGVLLIVILGKIGYQKFTKWLEAD